MNERTLHRLFQSIVLTSLPLVACGGSFDSGEADEPSGGTSSGGTASGGTSSGGTASGGKSQGGSDAGGTSSAGAGAGGSSGGSAGTGATGGNAGSAGSGGGLTCWGPIGPACSLPRTVVIDRGCMDPTLPPTVQQCEAYCPSETESPLSGGCGVATYDAQSITINCYGCAVIGRRVGGFDGGDCPDRTLAAELARMALLEGVSVQAFRDLRRELGGLGAPRSLLRRLSRAGRDEIRHARRTRALARRFGGQVAATPRLPVPPRSLEAIAQENMVEGCVRETFGALVAHYQSTRARDPELRAALTRIARDETRHSALSWALHAWFDRRLDRSARERVRAARQAAAEHLYAELAASPPDDPESLAGFPAPEMARALFRQAFPSLWS